MSLFIHNSISRFLSGLTILLTAYSVSSCTNDSSQLAGSCGNCHQPVLDAAHQIPCTSCHLGNDRATTIEGAHTALLPQPAHPSSMDRTCGSCHEQAVASLTHSSHLSLNNFIHLVRTSFGAEDSIPSLVDIPPAPSPSTISELADDLLRRRCLRCHLYSSGDEYTETQRATGCGACHLKKTAGKLTSHVFQKYPADRQCLSCHYGNRAGADYYGRYEHDFNREYRTPYTAEESTARPYGVEYHQLAPDIHQQGGMVCIDCHTQSEVMGSQSTGHQTRCGGCHDLQELEHDLPPGINRQGSDIKFSSSATGRTFDVPTLAHEAHASYSNVHCQVCHAQWSFNDTETHLLRSDTDNYEIWSHLTVQDSYEIEQFLEHNLDFDNQEMPVAMSDKITGEKRSGVWYKGYLMRRWEWPRIRPDVNDVLYVTRPVLNLTLSWIDEYEEIRFDNHRSSAPDDGYLPYIPHTTGRAGVFYELRLQQLRSHTTTGE